MQKEFIFSYAGQRATGWTLETYLKTAIGDAQRELYKSNLVIQRGDIRKVIIEELSTGIIEVKLIINLGS